MIGFVVVFGFVAIMVWTNYWLDKSFDWSHEGVALFIAALPWLIGLACFINFMVSPMDSAIDEASECHTEQSQDYDYGTVEMKESESGSTYQIEYEY